jgi:methionyl-tRNA synthetase
LKIEKPRSEEAKKSETTLSFNKLNLKVAEILEAKPHPNADKLCVLKISLGTEERQIVAGIRAWLAPEQLIGKRIIVVTNLEPANLRGEPSNGMLLASLHENSFKLLEAPKTKPGKNAFIDGSIPNESQISFNEFKEIKFTLKDKHILIDGKPLKTEKETIILDQPDGSEIR